jgi:hypothetical protein
MLIMRSLWITPPLSIFFLNPNKGSAPYLIGKPAPKHFIISNIKT